MYKTATPLRKQKSDTGLKISRAVGVVNFRKGGNRAYVHTSKSGFGHGSIVVVVLIVLCEILRLYACVKTAR